MTKAQQRDLEDVLGRLNKAIAFIDNDSIKIMKSFGSTGTHEVNKHIGSDLNYLRTAQERLNEIIKQL
jgi:hypothetical protein